MLILACAGLSLARVSVDFDKQRIEAGKGFTLILSLPTTELPPNHGIPTLDDLQGFTLTRLDSSDEHINDFFRGRVNVRRYNFHLIAPKQGGSYQLPLSWELDGNVRSLGKVRVDVQRPFDASALAVSLTPSKHSVYEGEQFALSMTMLTYENFQGNINLAGIDLGNDFVAHRAELKAQFTNSSRPGVTSEATAKVAWLSAIRPGKLVIPEVKIKYMKIGEPKMVNKKMGSFSFSSYSQQPEEATALSGRVNMDVRPLPSQGKPADFTGMVGQYTFDVQPDRNALQIGEALTLLVHIRGNGKPGSISDPKFPDFTEFRSVPPEAQTTTSEVNGQIWSDRTIKVFLYPKKKGEFRIAPMHYSWFDPNKGRYQEASSPEFIIQVEKGDITQAAASGGSSYTPVNSVEKKNIEALGQDIRFIHEPKFLHNQSARWYRSPWFWILLLLPFALAWFGSRSIARRQALLDNAAYQKRSKAGAALQKVWNEVNQASNNNDPKAMLALIEQGLLTYAGALYNVELGGLTRAKLQETLQVCKVNAEQISALERILDACDRARFCPMDAESQETKRLVEDAQRWAEHLGRMAQ